MVLKLGIASVALTGSVLQMCIRDRWDTAKYIRRMEKRLAEKPHECEVETAVYAHGTHFVFPEGMLKKIGRAHV